MKKTYISIEWGDQRTRFERAEAIKKALQLVAKRAVKQQDDKSMNNKTAA